MSTKNKPKGYIKGLRVDDEVYVIRNGRRVVVARYRNGRKVWDERTGK